MTLRSLVIASAMLLGLVGTARAQEPLAFIDYVRSDLDWYTVETEHFLVHFHSDENGEGSRTARVVARIAEEIYGPITSLYGHEPNTKVSFILKDYEDYSNGAAYFFDNMIEIWAPALQTPFRGNHNWLRNVITHEFTHMVQVQTTMKASRRVPFMYLQVLDYENTRRPDVLYGFPNLIASYPVPILNNPAWLAEGTAQFQRSDMDYDRWDAHRDMMLRTQVLAGKELSLVDMGGFYSHTSLGRESVYNHGFAFSRYLADRFGEEGLRTLSESLGEWNNLNFEQATKDAFGIPGDEIYDDWMRSLRDHYRATARESSPYEVIEPDGFHNYWAVASPDGSRLAYVSNRGEDFSRSGIWVRDVDNDDVAHLVLPESELGLLPGYTCSLGHRLVQGVSGSVAWTPDSGSLIYARTRDDQQGHLVLDLYRVDLTTKEKQRLTRGLRASMPTISPDGTQLAMIIQGDGSTNLALMPVPAVDADPAGEDALHFLTRFEDGSQVTDPVWHPDGTHLYFGLQRSHGRDIARVDVALGAVETILGGPEDERNATFDAEGRMVYASDRNGIYNLYRLNTDGSSDALTDLEGGAFMPSVMADGSVVFSAFEAGGYRIARLPEPVVLQRPQPYVAPLFLGPFDTPGSAQHAEPDADQAMRSFTKEEMASEASAYRPVFTSMSFLPVLRLDQYVSRQRSRAQVRLPDRGRAETLWRNTKLGVYASTREVLGGMSFFGGILVGPGSTESSTLGDFLSPSNLIDLERDAFLQVDYSRGLPFINARWNPHISAQVFNIRRHVENGLDIEEFPCTACYPETTLGNLTYNLWEVDLKARSKISRVLLAEVGYRYSPYRVKTNSFFSRELQQTVGSSSSRYFIGRAWTTRLTYEGFHPHINSDVVPDGVRAELEFDTEAGRLLGAFDIQDGMLRPVYEASRVNRITFTARGGTRLPGWTAPGTHGLGFRMRASTILGGEKDDFYDDYVGGLTGARGYPFYALGGNRTAWTQVSWLFPLAARIGRQASAFYLDKVYGRVYADAAVAWSGAFPGLGSVRKDVGAELRFSLGSFYLLPTALFASATYGLDAFDFELDEGFVTPSGDRSVRYGGEVAWHFGLLFEFDQF